MVVPSLEKVTEIQESLSREGNMVDIVRVLPKIIIDMKVVNRFGNEIFSYMGENPDTDYCIDFQNSTFLIVAILGQLIWINKKYNETRNKRVSFVGVNPHFYEVIKLLHLDRPLGIKSGYGVEDYKRDNGYVS